MTYISGMNHVSKFLDDAHNKKVEQREIKWLKTAPEKVVLYCNERGIVSTWLGTRVSTHEWIGPRRHVGFGYHTYRRAVSCKIFGVLYHGWFMESSGDLVRLKKAKKQK